MPLEQIGAVLQAPDVDTRNELIARHLARLEESLAQTQAAVASLRDLLQGPRRRCASSTAASRRWGPPPSARR